MKARNPIYRWLTLLGLLVLLMPLLAACGAEAPNTNAPTNNEPTVGTQVDTPPTLAPAGTAPVAGDATAPTAGGAETPAGAEGEATTGATAAVTAAATAAGGDTGAGTGAPREGTAGGTAVVGIVQEPDILDPFVTGMTFAVWILHTTDVPMIRAGLEGKLEPMLLTEVPTVDNGGITENGLTYTVKFKEGLKWSDGKPLTAQDLVFTWKTVMTPEYGAASTLGWDQIKDIKLSNNNLTATITLKAAYAPFLAAVLAGTGDVSAGFLLPAHKFEGMQPAQYTKSDYGLAGSKGHVGNGPFKLEEWRKGDQIRLVRNDNYFGEPALLDGIVFSVLENTDQQTTQLQNGDIDMATNYTEGDIPTLEQLSGQGVTLIANPAVGSIERFIFNLKDPKDPKTKENPAQAKDHPVFGDKNVRMAIAMAMNRPAIVENLLYNKTKPGITELDNTQWLNEELQPYPYDPEQAKQLLDQAGWKPGGDGIREKNGQRLSFTHVTTSGNPLRERVQRGIINDLKNVGVEMKIGNVKPDKLFASYSQGGVAATGAYDMVGYTTGISPLDPDLTPFYATDQIPSKANNGVGSNNGRYSNPEVDKLLEQQATEVDPEARQKLLDQIQKIVYDDVAVIYMYDRLRIDAAGANLKGYQADPTAGLWWNPEDWYLQEQQ